MLDRLFGAGEGKSLGKLIERSSIGNGGYTICLDTVDSDGNTKTLGCFLNVFNEFGKAVIEMHFAYFRDAESLNKFVEKAKEAGIVAMYAADSAIKNAEASNLNGGPLLGLTALADSLNLPTSSMMGETGVVMKFEEEEGVQIAIIEIAHRKPLSEPGLSDSEAAIRHIARLNEVFPKSLRVRPNPLSL
ncbi:MAG: hypothetical protein AAB656_02300 [Patescibacteria group bacterium]